MDIQQLQYFQVLATKQHMTKAASELNITQPALSSSLSRLENELDLLLFDRSGRKITLNKNGKTFLPYVNNILNEYNTAISALQNCKEIQKSTISLLISGSSFPKYIIRGFCRQYPDISIQQQLIRSDQMNPSIFNQHADFLLTAYPFDFPEFEKLTVYEEAFYLAVSMEHPLASHSSVTVEELKNENFICLPKGEIFRNMCEDICQRAGFTPNVVIECYPSQISALLENTVNVAFTIESSLYTKEFGSNIRLIPFSSPQCTRKITLVYRKGSRLSYSAKLFFNYCQNYRFIKN